jgi:hypothetical protein
MKINRRIKTRKNKEMKIRITVTCSSTLINTNNEQHKAEHRQLNISS